MFLSAIKSLFAAQGRPHPSLPALEDYSKPPYTDTEHVEQELTKIVSRGEDLVLRQWLARLAVGHVTEDHFKSAVIVALHRRCQQLEGKVLEMHRYITSKLGGPL